MLYNLIYYFVWFVSPISVFFKTNFVYYLEVIYGYIYIIYNIIKIKKGALKRRIKYLFNLKKSLL